MSKRRRPKPPRVPKYIEQRVEINLVGSSFDESAVRKMLEAINESVKDGARLVVA